MHVLEYIDTYASSHQPYKNGSWCYEDGLIYRGLEMLFNTTGEKRWLDHVIRLIGPQLKAGPQLLGYDANEYNIDNVMAGRALLFLHDVTGDGQYLSAAALLIRQLETHPRTHSGVYWHKLRYPWQVWLDGLYMGLPFQIRYGQKTKNEALISDALMQFEMALEMTFVPQTNLYAHAVDEAKKQPWAEPQTGQTKAHWARSLGWLTMAMIDIHELVGAEKFASFRERVEALFKSIYELRQPDGTWLQVIDQPGLDGNWSETSATAMFVYSLLKASELGLWRGPTDGFADQLVKNTLRPKADGGLEMVGMCHVAGLGMYQGRFRDGTAKYYISESKISDDPKGVAPLIMAVATHIKQMELLPSVVAGE